jgi:hypothetical protein
MTNEGLSSGPKLPSLLRRIGLSFLLGFALFVLGALLQGALRTQGISGISIYVDDLVLGVVSGLVVFVYEQRRYKAIREKIATISAMNHHVRNALQAISYAPHAEQAKQIELIQQSVSRIQWALREVLPGTAEPQIKMPETTSRTGNKTPV